MPSIKTYKKYMGQHESVGRYLKDHADFVMEELWDRDIQSQTAYIYDYFHDDQPALNHGMTYENTTKTPVPIKFIVTEHGSMSKDEPSAYIQFLPSFKTSGFVEGDDLYYFEDYVRDYSSNPFIGKYIDIRDEKGIYHKWMICLEDIQGNQFPKYFILPCRYNLEWIRRDGNRRIKQRMWCVLRSQSSYKKL